MWIAVQHDAETLLEEKWVGAFDQLVLSLLVCDINYLSGKSILHSIAAQTNLPQFLIFHFALS